MTTRIRVRVDWCGVCLLNRQRSANPRRGRWYATLDTWETERFWADEPRPLLHWSGTTT